MSEPYAELDRKLALLIITGEDGRAPRGFVAKGCVQVSVELLREIREALRQLAATPQPEGPGPRGFEKVTPLRPETAAKFWPTPQPEGEDGTPLTAAEAMLAERESCALYVEELDRTADEIFAVQQMRKRIANAIRARSMGAAPITPQPEDAP